MRALDIEDNIEHLRYDKVATLSNPIGEGLGVRFATDADVDGLHPALASNSSAFLMSLRSSLLKATSIRSRQGLGNLLITYFFKFFEPLVHDGHLYVLETPLFPRCLRTATSNK